MNLIHGICLLCKQTDQVLESEDLQLFLKFIVNTYFVKQNNLAWQFRKRINSQSLCVVCACNVEASYKFKKTYEDKIKKETTVKKTLSCCFMCGFRGSELVQTDSNPNQFQENVSLFMEAISQPRFYKQCAVCFVCVLELQNFSKMHASLHAHIKENDTRTNEIQENKEVDDPPIEKEIPEISTPITEKTLTSSTSELNMIETRSDLKPKRARSESASPVEAPPRKSLRAVNTSKSSTSLNNSFTLSNCESVKNLVDSGKIIIPETVSSDKKMYVNIPYVKVERKIGNIFDESLKSTTNLQDDTNLVKDKTPVKLSEFFQGTKMSKPKVSIKIKLIEKIERKRAKSKKKLNQCTLCNEHFNSICLLKSHQLWHEKPEQLQVNIIRTDISANLKLSQEQESTIVDNTENAEISEGNQLNKDEIDTEEIKNPSENEPNSNETAVDELNSEVNSEKMETNIEAEPCSSDKDVNELSSKKDKSENDSSNTSVECSTDDNKMQNSEESITETDSRIENQKDCNEIGENNVEDKISISDEEECSIQNEVVEIINDDDKGEGKTENIEPNAGKEQDECCEDDKKESGELDDAEQNNRTSQQAENEDTREENAERQGETGEEDTNKKIEQNESEKEPSRNAISVEQESGDDGKDKETEGKEEECQNVDMEEKECDNKEENAKQDSVKNDENEKDNLNFNLDLMDTTESMGKEKDFDSVQSVAEVNKEFDEIESNLEKLLEATEDFKGLEEKEQKNENKSSNLTDVSKTMSNKYGEDNANVFNSCSNENSNVIKTPSNTILKRKCSNKSNEDSPKTKKVRFATDIIDDEQKNKTSENENKIQKDEVLS